MKFNYKFIIDIFYLLIAKISGLFLKIALPFLFLKYYSIQYTEFTLEYTVLLFVLTISAYGIVDLFFRVDSKDDKNYFRISFCIITILYTLLSTSAYFYLVVSYNVSFYLYFLLSIYFYFQLVYILIERKLQLEDDLYKFTHLNVIYFLIALVVGVGLILLDSNIYIFLTLIIMILYYPTLLYTKHYITIDVNKLNFSDYSYFFSKTHYFGLLSILLLLLGKGEQLVLFFYSEDMLSEYFIIARIYEIGLVLIALLSQVVLKDSYTKNVSPKLNIYLYLSIVISILIFLFFSNIYVQGLLNIEIDTYYLLLLVIAVIIKTISVWIFDKFFYEERENELLRFLIIAIIIYLPSLVFLVAYFGVLGAICSLILYPIIIILYARRKI